MLEKVFDILHDWKRRDCVLATMHGKEEAISPVLSATLGVTVEVPKYFDTDRFGTFTRDIRRVGTQLEAARAKAVAAMELTGLDLAVSSEGSFGTHPDLPFLPSNLELVLLVDKKHKIEIAGHFRSSTVMAQGLEVLTVDDAVAAAIAWGFPGQGVIVRLSKFSNQNIYKDVSSVVELREVVTKLLLQSSLNTVYIETDMRAHRCPTRMDTIKEAAASLVKNCQSQCPRCGCPGFVVVDTIVGLPCRDCRLPTDDALAIKLLCQKCHHAEQKPVSDAVSAEPGQCAFCNP